MRGGCQASPWSWRFKLKGSYVACCPLRTIYAALVGFGARAGVSFDEVHRRAVRLEGYGRGRAAIVLQAVRIEERVGV